MRRRHGDEGQRDDPSPRRRATSREEIKRLEKAVFDQRFHGQSEEKADRGLVRRTRRDVARILTVLRERELAGTAHGAAVPRRRPRRRPRKEEGVTS